MSRTINAPAILFALVGKVDTDNIAPVIWACARSDRRVIVVVSSTAASKMISESWWSAECPEIQVVQWENDHRVGSLFERVTRLQWNKWRVRRLLQRHEVGLVVVEWGEGRAVQPEFVLRRMYLGCFASLRRQLLCVAHDMQIPTVALPHGHSTKTSLIQSAHVRAMMNRNDGRLPFADRDSFDTYVFAAHYHKEAVLAHSDMSGRNAAVLGSARFNDLWVTRLYEHTPTAVLPHLRGEQRRRVLFFIPKWNNLVDVSQTIDLMLALGSHPSLQLVVRGHLRSDDAALSHEHQDRLTAASNIVFADNGVSSPALIKACDVLIDVDSSIAFDAVLLRKPYIRPKYLQDKSVSTIWDRLGGAHVSSSCEETLRIVTRADLVAATRDPSFDQIVFGGPGGQVLDAYVTELSNLLTKHSVK